MPAYNKMCTFKQTYSCNRCGNRIKGDRIQMTLSDRDIGCGMKVKQKVFVCRPCFRQTAGEAMTSLFKDIRKAITAPKGD